MNDVPNEILKQAWTEEILTCPPSQWSGALPAKWRTGRRVAEIRQERQNKTRGEMDREVMKAFFLDPFDTQGQKINALGFRLWLKPLAGFFLTRSDTQGRKINALSFCLWLKPLAGFFLTG